MKALLMLALTAGVLSLAGVTEAQPGGGKKGGGQGGGAMPTAWKSCHVPATARV